MQLQRRMATATPSGSLQSKTRRRANRRLRLPAEVDLWHLAPNSRQGQCMLFTSGKDIICPAGAEDTDPARDQDSVQSLTYSEFHFELLGTTREVKRGQDPEKT
ncbi:hypothetical protein INR49_027625 [Caranx melampygus]|nr:hypothetical protein INR49_027625 [Caranx melampygus]